MSIQSLDLVWIVVKDLKEAVQFYTEVVGMELKELHEGYGWAELSGHTGGARLGIAQENEKDSVRAGQNGVVTLSVKDLLLAKADLEKKGALMVGDVMEVPGMVKLQMVQDTSGNHFQLVQVLN